MINTIENLFKVEATDYTDRATKHFPDWAKETMRTSLKRKKKNGDKKVKTDCKFLNSNKWFFFSFTFFRLTTRKRRMMPQNGIKKYKVLHRSKDARGKKRRKRSLPKVQR